MSHGPLQVPATTHRERPGVKEEAAAFVPRDDAEDAADPFAEDVGKVSEGQVNADVVNGTSDGTPEGAEDAGKAPEAADAVDTSEGTEDAKNAQEANDADGGDKGATEAVTSESPEDGELAAEKVRLLMPVP